MKKILFILSCSIFFRLSSWPFFFSESPQTPRVQEKPPFTIMIDPAGDARNPGRIIDDTYERALTMQCAEELKQILEAEPNKCRVILTRFPGEAIEPLQNITFANRLGVDLYISLGFFQHTGETPRISWYMLIYDPATDIMSKKGTALELLPYDQAYKLSLTKTKQLSALAYTACSTTPKIASCATPHAIPYKPLVGIMAPALGLEIGIQHKPQAKQVIPLIAQALKALVST